MKTKQLLILLILIILSSLSSSQQIIIQATCSCSQIFTQVECERRSGCQWDTTQKLCSASTSTTNPEKEKIVTYCQQYILPSDCANANPCEWNGTLCTHFTGCTAYTFTSYEKCQEVSTRCITDGVHCVEIAACSTYKTQTACKQNMNGKYCHWNLSDTAKPLCQDAFECSQLPSILNRDALCRAQLDKCTAQASGGCVESGVKCEDQVSEIGCVTNKDRIQQCFWASGKCFDKTCDNALLTLKTDQDCKDFLSICSTKLGGGCVIRSTCQAAIQAACVKDNTGVDCFWNGNNCLIKTCANALTSNKTNESCQNYLPNCITNGAGCVDNTGCEAAKIKDACDKTLNGTQCHWDGTQCKVKNCQNAGPSYVGHDSCTAFMANCTAREAVGCTDRTCSNAQNSNNTNDLCKLYYPGGNCITKYGGGCRVNSTCEEIDLDQACITDIDGKTCFWDGGCKTKICANSPSSYNTHALCQQFLSTCTIGSGSTCVDKICENIKAESDCTTDLNNKVCSYKGKCYQKFCALASKDINTHADCQAYLPSCTLDNSGFGCMTLPLRCEAITQTRACIIKADGGKCGLSGTSCVDRTCSTLSADGSSLNTTNACNTYKTGCVVNNNLDGCMDLPMNCADRQQSENCEIEENPNQKCQQNPSGKECMEIQCENAHFVTLANGVDQDGCWAYYNKKCIINSQGNGCIPRPKTCSGLHEDACKYPDVLEGDISCYWDLGTSSCKDIACSSITFLPDVIINHDACQAQNKFCTVDKASSPTGCIPLQKSCTQYTFAEQCKKDSNDVPCKFIIGVSSAFGTCIYQPCADAYDSILTDGECQQFSSRCTVAQKRCRTKRATCADYQSEDLCYMHTMFGLCTWDGDKCVNLVEEIECVRFKAPGLTDGYCQSLSTSCSVNASKTSCIVAQATCDGYKVSENCAWSTTEKKDCVWTISGTCANSSTTKCSQIAGTSASACAAIKKSCSWASGSSCKAYCGAATGVLDYDLCKQFGFDCTIKLNGTACVEKASTCQLTDPANCTSSDEGLCHLVNGACILSSGNLVSSNNCSTITGTRLTVSYCKGIGQDGNSCSVNALQTSCTQMLEGCSSYSLNNCFYSGADLCVIVNGNCAQFNPNTDTCSNIIINGIINYTDYLCQKFKSTCRAKSDQTGCQNIINECSQFTGENLTPFYCLGMKSTCSVNSARTACVPIENYCLDYSISNCNYSRNEGDCIIQNNQCIQKSCDRVSTTGIISMDKCQTYSSNCILVLGGCSERSSCSSYQFQGACVKNAAGGDCLWNPIAAKCVNKSCSAAEASNSFDSDAECSKAGNCTVKANDDKSIGSGCMARTACTFYVNSEQCKLSDQGVTCLWVTNDPLNPFCSEKSCKTASISLNDHVSCSQYLTGCTVDVIDVNGILTPQGCTELKQCVDYKIEAQCVKSIDKDNQGNDIECGWNGSFCANKSCQTAQSSQNTHELCNTYLLGCTVNATNDGCVLIPQQCEGMTQNQCFEGSVDSNNRKCYWLDESTGCITKTCENSPNYATASECDSYLEGCTTDEVKCKTKICEDFPFTTDSQCITALDGGICTTNGTICVTRGSCAQAQAEAGCFTDIQGRLCQWITLASGSFCTLRTCNTAPNILTTVEQCQQYFTPQNGSCTTKKEGGCITKGTCDNESVEAACKKDSNGADCVWDVDICRLKDCQDFPGTSHAECNKIKSNCTVGLNGKCAKMVNCESTTVRAACIIGNDGPCLWIDEYLNFNGSKGACFSYESCKSLDWTTDAQCKLISSNCTTNGKECIAITSCGETNTNGGCKYGTDGECIQTVQAKEAKNVICKKFTTCDTAYYLTHDECYQANPNCTTDSINGCIPITACSSYTEIGKCNFSKDGVIVDSKGGISSTGVCIWDIITKKCRNQQCQDIVLTTDFECAGKLMTCSSDGITCIDKGACSTYTKSNACDNARGVEGACFWVIANGSTAASCRTKTCADIPHGITTLVCSEVSNCVSDGTNCIVKSVCAQYLTKIGCESQGTDGLCVWTELIAPATQGKCALMTGCALAKDDQTCNQARNRCTWNSMTKVCAEHSCETYRNQVGMCTFFYSWNMEKYNICQTVQGKCVAADAAILSQGDCYTLTAYQYSWNPTQSKCVQCRNIVPNTNSTENETATTTDSGYILTWLSAVLIYLLL